METFFSDLNFWHWLILAGILLMAELTSGSGFILWIAIGGVVTSLITYVMPNLHWPWQLLWFSTFSIVACYLWWRYLKTCTEISDKPNLNRRTQNFIGRTYTLERGIENGRGKIKIGDSYWLVEGPDQDVGTKVRVISVDGVILKVEGAE